MKMIIMCAFKVIKPNIEARDDIKITCFIANISPTIKFNRSASLSIFRLKFI